MRSVLACAAFGGFARLFKKGLDKGRVSGVVNTRSKHHFARSTICFRSISCVQSTMCVQLCPMFLDISAFPCFLFIFSPIYFVSGVFSNFMYNLDHILLYLQFRLGGGGSTAHFQHFEPAYLRNR